MLLFLVNVKGCGRQVDQEYFSNRSGGANKLVKPSIINAFRAVLIKKAIVLWFSKTFKSINQNMP